MTLERVEDCDRRRSSISISSLVNTLKYDEIGLSPDMTKDNKHEKINEK
jgi:hypothetical protein